MDRWIKNVLRYAHRDERGGIFLLPPLYKVVIAPPGGFGAEQTSTFNPDLHPETDTVDGIILCQKGGSPTWASLLAGPATSVIDNTAVGNCAITDFAGTNRGIQRSIFLFKLAGITAGSLIVSATFQLRGNSKSMSGVQLPAIRLVPSTPASNTSLALGDYFNVGSTQLATSDITYADWKDDESWNTFTLNAAGLAAVTAAIGGILKLGVREANYDISGSAPPANTSASFYTRFAESADVTDRPLLTVKWKPPL